MSPTTALADFRGALRSSAFTVALTGAGVSTDSGIPDFRGDAGLWTDVDPMDVASVEGFEADPARFYRFWAGKFAAIADAEPGPAHRYLASLEEQGQLHGIVTQNIDGLHQKAGSKRVIEAHGSFQEVHCLSCGAVEGVATVFARAGARAPACQTCGGRRLKPGVVLFGEALPASFAEADAWARRSELLIAMGTSLGVYPVAGLVAVAKRSGARIAILNRDPTPFDAEADWVLHGELRELVGALT
ncbi:MAG: NAD-dependent deacylase [Myxococcota bacterium]